MYNMTLFMKDNYFCCLAYEVKLPVESTKPTNFTLSVYGVEQIPVFLFKYHFVLLDEFYSIL